MPATAPCPAGLRPSARRRACSQRAASTAARPCPWCPPGSAPSANQCPARTAKWCCSPSLPWPGGGGQTRSIARAAAASPPTAHASWWRREVPVVPRRAFRRAPGLRPTPQPGAVAPRGGKPDPGVGQVRPGAGQQAPGAAACPPWPVPVALVGRVRFPRAWLRPLGEQAETLFSRAAACCYSGAILVASPASGPLAARFEGGQLAALEGLAPAAAPPAARPVLHLLRGGKR